MGNSTSRRSTRHSASVHPHIRGELSVPQKSASVGNGSSPHTWGTLPSESHHAVAIRFIPTYVGNSEAVHDIQIIHAVHPHIRGELRCCLRISSMGTGSSPHTWGTLQSSELDRPGDRFIPTYVGNSDSTSSCRSLPPVHPHIRGELEKVIGAPGPLSGSSPHTWGTLLEDLPDRNPRRFIPTYVGNSATCPTTPRGTSVHPHIRGEL